METIFSTAFGRVIKIQKGESNRLTEAANSIFSGVQDCRFTSADFWITVSSKKKDISLWPFPCVYFNVGNFPCFEPIMPLLSKGNVFRKSLSVLSGAAQRMIQERRKERDTHKVWLQPQQWDFLWYVCMHSACTMGYYHMLFTFPPHHLSPEMGKDKHTLKMASYRVPAWKFELVNFALSSFFGHLWAKYQVWKLNSLRLIL